MDEATASGVLGLLPAVPPRQDNVLLREMAPSDVALALELATDAYVPLIGTLPAHASMEQALDWIDRQRGERLAHRQGLTFAIAEADTDRAVGTSASGCPNCATGGHRRATAWLPAPEGGASPRRRSSH